MESELFWEKQTDRLNTTYHALHKCFISSTVLRGSYWLTLGRGIKRADTFQFNRCSVFDSKMGHVLYENIERVLAQLLKMKVEVVKELSNVDKFPTQVGLGHLHCEHGATLRLQR